jgi:FkbM family methyltransferase
MLGLNSVIRNVLERRNLVLVRVDRQFGVQVLADIRHLASAWKYPIETLFDVGANIGQTARKFLKEFPQARIFSFEPHPSTFAKLMANVGANTRLRGVNVALGAEAGEVQMMEFEDSRINCLASNAPVLARFHKEGSRIPVKGMTLDTFCEESDVGSIDILKIDTEGFDLMVLRGADRMLRERRIKFIYVEYNDLHPSDGVFGGALVPMDLLLRPYGFRYIASYNDYITLEGEMFSVSNALFALPPQAESNGKH